MGAILALQFGGKGGLDKGGRAKRDASGKEAIGLQTAGVTGSEA